MPACAGNWQDYSRLRINRVLFLIDVFSFGDKYTRQKWNNDHLYMTWRREREKMELGEEENRQKDISS